MSNLTELEVYKALREAQNRYTYFLLAAAAAAVSVALNQTETATLRLSHVPLGLAVLSWGVSFFCGCRNLTYISSTLYANAELLRIQGGQHPKVGQHPGLISAASDGILAAMDQNSNRANHLGRWQFRLLIIGALLYIGWHVGQMYLRTPHP